MCSLMMQLLLYFAVLRFLYAWKSPRLFRWLFSKRYRLTANSVVRCDVIAYTFHREEPCEKKAKVDTTSSTSPPMWRHTLDSPTPISHRVIEGRPLYIWDMIVANAPGCISRYLALRRLTAPASPNGYRNSLRHRGRWVGPSPLRNVVTASHVEEHSPEGSSTGQSLTETGSGSDCSTASTSTASSMSEEPKSEPRDKPATKSNDCKPE